VYESIRVLPINYLKRCLRLVLSHPYRIGFVTVLSIAKEWTTKKRVSSTSGSTDISIEVFCITSKPRKEKVDLLYRSSQKWTPKIWNPPNAGLLLVQYSDAFTM
jgi:hypothetical protein